MPSLNSDAHVVPQLIPEGELTIDAGLEPVWTMSSSTELIGVQETVSKVVPTTFWSSADIVVVPQETAVAFPVLSMLATYVLLESHATVSDVFSVPSLDVSTATNPVVCPI